MALVNLDEAARWDAVLDSLGLVLAWNESDGNPYQLLAPDVAVERQELSVDLSENKLDRLYWGANRSWHEGAGQKRLNVPDVSSAFRFLDGEGIDISAKGEVKAGHAVSRVLTLTNQGPLAPIKTAPTDTHLWVAAGQPNLRKMAALDGSDVATVSTGTETSKEVLDMASDGVQVYVALSTDGIHRTGVTTTTLRESFDLATGWSGASLTFAADTSNKLEGTGSLLVTNATSASRQGDKTVGPFDFSAVDQFKIRLYAVSYAATGVKIRLQSSAGNYAERTIPALPADAWYEDVSTRTTDWTSTGSPNWAATNQLSVIVPAVPELVLRSSSSASNADTSITIAKPSDVVSGDLLLAQICAGSLGGVPSIAIPADWTELRWDMTDVVDDNRIVQGIYYRVATASEAASYTWTGTKPMAGIIMSFKDIDTANPISASGGQANNTPSTSIVAPTITPAVDGCKIVQLFSQIEENSTVGADITITITPPSGTVVDQTPRITSSLYPMAAKAAHEHQATAAATGTRTATSTRTAVGIGQLVALKPANTTTRRVNFDDLRSVSSATLGHWSDWDARVLAWAKDAIYAAGIKTGTQWRFFQAGATTTSTEISTLPDGWEVTDIIELGGFIYFSANRGANLGAIYAYDGVNAPFIARRLPPGDIPLSLTPFEGTGMLIGGRRASSSASGGLGILRRAFPAGSGHLTTEVIAEYGTQDDGRDYGIKAGAETGKGAVYGINFSGSGARTALGLYLPLDGGYANYLSYQTSGGVVEDVAHFKGRHIFTIGATGVIVEQMTYPTSGVWLSSSIIDLNVEANKVWLLQETSFDPLPSGASVTHEYSTDGETWTGGAVASTALSTSLRTQRNITSPRIQYRLTVSPITSESPVVRKSGIGGWMASKPRPVHRLLVRAYPASQDRTGRHLYREEAGYSLMNELLTRQAAGTVLDYQPPWYMHSQDGLRVRVADVQLAGGWGTAGRKQGGVIQLELAEAPE